MIKDSIPGQNEVDLQHLRRFARPKYIPDHVTGQRDLIKEMHAVPRTWGSTPQTVMQTPTTTAWEWSNPKRDRVSAKPTTLYLLVCPVKLVSLGDLHKLLLQHPPFCSSADSWAYPLELKKIIVPLLPPISVEQAAEWSIQYWPTFYRKTNPFGAHPGTISKAESDLQDPEADNISIEHAMRLAEDAAQATTSKGYGLQTGCVIVERVEDKTEIIAVAGDARFKPLQRDNPIEQSAACCQGNPACHSVMRAIGMVARKRLRCASQTVARAANKASHTLETAAIDQTVRDGFFLDQPLTSLEQSFFTRDNLKPDGYLCLKLEIFLTHEPCIMCSMALVHSRVGRVIFKNRMPKTGGLTAEMTSNVSGPVGLGYGLCWRKELNWQFMCWEYCADPSKHPQLSEERNLPLHSTFLQAAKPIPNGVDAGATMNGEKPPAAATTAVEKYTEPIVHHRHRKNKHEDHSTIPTINTASTPAIDTAITSTPTSTTSASDTEHLEHGLGNMSFADPSVSSFASVHV